MQLVKKNDIYNVIELGSHKMAHQIMLAIKLDDLSSSPGTHMAKTQNSLSQKADNLQQIQSISIFAFFVLFCFKEE